MGLSKISNEDQDKEKEILNQLFQAFRFKRELILIGTPFQKEQKVFTKL